MNPIFKELHLDGVLIGQNEDLFPAIKTLLIISQLSDQ